MEQGNKGNTSASQVKFARTLLPSDQSRSSLLNKSSGGTIPGAATDVVLSFVRAGSPVMPTIVGNPRLVVGVACKRRKRKVCHCCRHHHHHHHHVEYYWWARYEG